MTERDDMRADAQETPDIRDDSPDAGLLKEIRDRYRYASDQWRETQNERRTDLRYVCGDPWDEKDKKERADFGRPAINHDELTQYTNAAINNVRQNKRGISVEPGGDGSDEKTAEFRQALIRAIEYKSQAQSTYITAFQNMVEGSYGFARVSRRYVSDDSDEQEIVIKNIPNPDSVLFDPDCKEADWSDARYCFVLDPMPIEEFRRNYPQAKIQDFSNEEMRVARDFLHDNNVLVCEYWRVEAQKQKRKTRTVEKRSLVQYITNGIEILERNPQPGELIAIVPFVGLERWIDDGAGAKRKLFSLVRLARDPQMSLAYLCSLEMEEAGLTPKAAYLGYKGQFDSDRKTWETITKQPHAFAQVDPIVDGATGAVLPLPQRIQFTPNFQAYEIAKDSCRRAVMSAMGISPLPTAAQRESEKSGVALEKIRDEQNLGSFHFQDNFERALMLMGRVIESWIPVVYDTERSVAIRHDDQKHEVVRINTAEPYPDPTTGELRHYPVAEAPHDVTISTAPAYDSQREEAAEFLDTLITNLKGLPLMPMQGAKLLALAIKMRQMGPLGDQMAEVVAPSDGSAEAQQQMGQMQAQFQMLQEEFQKLQQENMQLKLEKAGRVIDNQAKMQLERMKIEAGITEAEIEAKAQDASERNEYVADMWSQLHSQAHESAMQAADHAHEGQLASQDAANAANQQAADQAHEQGMAAQQQSFEGQQAQGEQQFDAEQTAQSQAHERSMTREGQRFEAAQTKQGHEHERQMVKLQPKPQQGSTKKK